MKFFVLSSIFFAFANADCNEYVVKVDEANANLEMCLTTMAPTTMAPTTMAPTTMAPTTMTPNKIVLGNTWNYNLQAPVNIDVDVDVFFMDMDDDTSQATIDSLHDKGKTVVCYISIGTRENWRSDYRDFPSDAVGRRVGGWAGEKWIDVNNLVVREIMKARIVKAKEMNCDAIEPDNMMVYSERRTGVSVTKSQQIEYNKWFAEQVHLEGMQVGLKNAVEIIDEFVNFFDFAINEQCFQYNECSGYSSFMDQNKAVFNVEYSHESSTCVNANSMGIKTIIKDLDLTAKFCSCSDPSVNLDCNLI